MMSSGLGRREPCVSCGEPVFLAQRLLVEKRLFHRTCFSCARCGTQLTLASYHHRPADPEGRYCCETCPDEETDSQGDDTSETTSNQDASSHDNVSTSEYNQILSDEEKVRNIKQFRDALVAERVAFDESLEKKMALTSGPSKAFSGFLNSQFEEESPPALPLSFPPSVHQESTVTAVSQVSSPDESVSKIIKDDIKCSNVTDVNNESNSNINSDSNQLLCSGNKDLNSESIRPVPLERKSKHLSVIETSPMPTPRGSVYSNSNNSIDIDNVNQLVTASDFKESNPCENSEVSAKDDKIITKDKMRYEKSDNCVDHKQDVDSEISQTSVGPSLVKSRMKLFEQVDAGTDQEYKVDQDTVTSDKVNDKRMIEDNVSDKLNDSSVVSDDMREEQSITQHDSLNKDIEASPMLLSQVESQEAEETSNVPLINNHTLDVNTPPGEINSDGSKCMNDAIIITHKTNGEDLKNNKELTGPQNDLHEIEEVCGENISNGTSEDQSNNKVETETNAIEGSEVEIDPIITNYNINKSLDGKEENIISEEEEDNKNPFGDEGDDGDAVSEKHSIQDVEEASQTNHSNVNVSASSETSASATKQENLQGAAELYPEELNPFSSDEDKEPGAPASTNPFGSCSEDEGEREKVQKGDGRRKSGEKPPRPPPPAILVHAAANKQNHNVSDQKKKIIPAPNLNPFGSDDDSEDDDLKHNLTTPTPATRMNDPPPSFHGSASSLMGTQRRKKPPAPRPPTQQLFTSPPQDGPTSIHSFVSTPNSLASPQLSPRSRKRRPAPPPPTTSSPLSAAPHHLMVTSSPIVATSQASPSPQLEHSRSSSVASHKKVISAADFDEQDLDTTSSGDWVAVGGELDKSNTSQLSSQYNIDQVSLTSQEQSSFNKSTLSRHRKGPAPAIPRIGSRGPVSAGALRRELALLEEQQRGLERQGVRLETLIRERTEDKEPPPEGTTDIETDELLLQLFDLVNEKNELFRRQAELMYLRKQQRLEEEQADLEQQVRVLMGVEESNKTDAEKQREEALLGRLVDVVQRRDLVVAALDQERLRERAEDQAVRERMTLHRAKLEELSSMSSADTHVAADKKEKKKKKHWMKRDKDKGKRGEGGGEDLEGVGGSTKKVKHKKWFK